MRDREVEEGKGILFSKGLTLHMFYSLFADGGGGRRGGGQHRVQIRARVGLLQQLLLPLHLVPRSLHAGAAIIAPGKKISIKCSESFKAEEECNKVGGYLADVVDQNENNWIKGILNAINPKDGTDYWLGGMDANADNGIQWLTGLEMTFTNFVDGEPLGRPYTHMDYDKGFAWNTKDDADDQVRTKRKVYMMLALIMQARGFLLAVAICNARTTASSAREPRP